MRQDAARKRDVHGTGISRVTRLESPPVSGASINPRPTGDSRGAGFAIADMEAAALRRSTQLKAGMA